MSDIEGLTSKFVKNPLAPSNRDLGQQMMRLVAAPIKGTKIHPDVPRADLFDVGIEFGAVFHGVAYVKSSVHSPAMTEDVMDIGRGMAKGLARQDVEALFARFEGGEVKPAPSFVS